MYWFTYSSGTASSLCTPLDCHLTGNMILPFFWELVKVCDLTCIIFPFAIIGALKFEQGMCNMYICKIHHSSFSLPVVRVATVCLRCYVCSLNAFCFLLNDFKVQHGCVLRIIYIIKMIKTMKININQYCLIYSPY